MTDFAAEIERVHASEAELVTALQEANDARLRLVALCRDLTAEVERLRAELAAIGDVAYRAWPVDAADALLQIQSRAKRAAGGA